jgi:mannosyl-3-phosphoglycerate phosphatase
VSAPERIVVFTDLDGTLLDADTYSFDGAQPALQELRRRGIPLVACTSKTAAETRHFLRRLESDAPYIVESGAGIYLPRGWGEGLRPQDGLSKGSRLLSLAADYHEVLEGMEEIRTLTGGAVRGFHDMSPDEIAQRTGLPLELATLAKGREFDEPFLLLREESRWPADLEALARRRGLALTKGGRFWHLHGDTDKGRAVEVVKSLYRTPDGRLGTIGAGDSAMDLPLLQAVDVPVIVAKPGGDYDPTLLEKVSGPVLSGKPGPAGWSKGVLEALQALNP